MVIVRKQVTPEGTVPGLESFAGEEVIVVRARTERVAKALEKPLMVLDDLRRFVSEHRDLMVRQAGEFNARYGNPADKARSYASKLGPEEFKARVRELNDYVENRLDTISKDLEKRYEDLEREVEGAVERIFAGAKKGADAEVDVVTVAAADDATDEPTEADDAAEPEGAAKSPRKARRRNK